MLNYLSLYFIMTINPSLPFYSPNFKWLKRYYSLIYLCFDINDTLGVTFRSKRSGCTSRVKVECVINLLVSNPMRVPVNDHIYLFEFLSNPSFKPEGKSPFRGMGNPDLEVSCLKSSRLKHDGR